MSRSRHFAAIAIAWLLLAVGVFAYFRYMQRPIDQYAAENAVEHMRAAATAFSVTTDTAGTAAHMGVPLYSVRYYKETGFDARSPVLSAMTQRVYLALVGANQLAAAAQAGIKSPTLDQAPAAAALVALEPKLKSTLLSADGNHFEDSAAALKRFVEWDSAEEWALEGRVRRKDLR